MTTQSLPPLSSVGSMVAKYPVDTIIEDRHCWLHVPIGRKGRTINVAKGIAMVSCTLHHAPIPSDCVKVQVLRVVDDQFLNNKLDYPNEDDGIKKLQDVVNNFILWHRQDIVFKDKVSRSPPRTEPSPLTHDKEAPPMPGPSPPSTHDKEMPPPLEPRPQSAMTSPVSYNNSQLTHYND
jgi:hypothetical protein